MLYCYETVNGTLNAENCFLLLHKKAKCYLNLPCAQAAGNGVDPAQKRTRPKHAFSGPEPPRDQRLLMSFRRVRQGRTNVFEKKLFGY